MHRAYSLEQVPADLPWPVVTLGTFDGVHLGHQKVLADTVNWARDRGGRAVVITFRQPPRAVTAGAPAPCITSLEHRLVLFERLGINLAVVLDFTGELAATPAEEFVEEVFCGALHARGVQWGFNCRFGRGAQGDIELLRRYEGQCRFEVRQSEPVLLEGRPVSSTAIREAIAAGGLAEAAGMLGRRVSVLGTVVRGVGRGVAIGFPTANLDLHHETVPPPGVYACLAVVRGEPHVAVANIGSCPTFDPPKPADFVEVHVLDFDRAIYGEDVEVQFIRFLRGEAKFDSVEQLVEQIRRDVEATRRIAAEAL